MEGKGHSEYTAPSSAIRAKRLGSSKSIRSKSPDSGPYPPEPARTSGKTAAILEEAARSRKEGLQSTPAPAPEIVRLRRRSGKTA